MFSFFTAPKSNDEDRVPKTGPDVQAQTIEAMNKVQAIVSYAPDGTIVDANPAYLEMMGFPRDGIVGQASSVLGSDVMPAIQAVLASGGNRSGEFVRKAGDGRDVWLQATFAPIRDNDGTVVSVVEFSTNLTAHRLAAVEADGKIAAIMRAQAVIEFDLDGMILTANDNFCATLGYDLDEILGQHHRMFVGEAFAKSPDYAEFWANLGRGNFVSGEFLRYGKDGSEVWIQASYSPILGPDGNPVKVVKFATDITAQKRVTADAKGQIDAISQSQAVIEFEPDGTILSANANFCSTLKYEEAEIAGRHHSMFVAGADANSPEYAQFWQDLAAGQFKSGEFRRIASDGAEIWIQATYTPILNAAGQVMKVVKFASDITQAKQSAADTQGQMTAISRSQAVIEFDLDGTILHANDNFLDVTGYTLDQIVGQHHRIFVDPQEAALPEYSDFWDKLNAGEYQTGQYRRRNSAGHDFWIQASYNPILDLNGRPRKIVKYAADITSQKKAIAALADAISSLADGDLTCRVDGGVDEDFAELAAAFNSSIERLQSMVDSIKTMSADIARESDEISRNAAEVSKGAEQQAASLEETAAAMEEISITNKHNASNSRDALQIVSSAAKKSEEGQEVSARARDAMGRIQESSQKVTEVITMIETVAFQTNLLALNAAVEAARAGEAGRGFAVVASEVRNLAQQSASAAGEITSLIKTSVENVHQGVKLVGLTGEALQAINEDITHANSNIESIAGAISEQATGVSEISEALASIDQSTQSNAQMAEKSSQNGKRLATQADMLKDQTNAFKTGSGSAAQRADFAA